MSDNAGVAGGYYMDSNPWNGQPKYVCLAGGGESIVYQNDCWIVDESENLVNYLDGSFTVADAIDSSCTGSSSLSDVNFSNFTLNYVDYSAPVPMNASNSTNATNGTNGTNSTNGTNGTASGTQDVNVNDY